MGEWDKLQKLFGLARLARKEMQDELDQKYQVNIPVSYSEFLKYFGKGNLGGFYHFHSPSEMNTHEERLKPFLNEELEELLRDSGNVLIFATSDNGDMLGWKLDEMVESVDPTVYLIPARSFEIQAIAKSVEALLLKISEYPQLFWPRLTLTYERIT